MSLSDPVVITCSISGTLANREQCPAIPYTPQEYGAEARRIVDEGGVMIHIHARKFAAALQHSSTGGPVLLRIEKHSGHGGADLIKATIEKTADEYSFTFSQLPSSASPATATR